MLDTWFSSALWPFSTLGWPEKTKELAMFYPTSILITSHDILFFWVARMMMMGLHFMDEVPFKDVYLHALVRDKFGKKMSKSTGNVIDPLDMIAQYGTDALRFTLTAFAAQGREIRLDEERVDGYRRFVNKLWNSARFADMHLSDASKDKLPALNKEDREQLGIAHRWIQSRCNATIKEVRTALDNYNFDTAASASYQFVWHLFCDWYLEWIKDDLFSKDAATVDRARASLLAVFEKTLKLLHPIIPFVTEEIWSNLPGERGYIMLESFPKIEATWDDPQAEEEMELLMGVISGLRTIRTEADLHPGAQIEATLICSNSKKRAQLETHRKSIMGMVRAKVLHITATALVPDDAIHGLVQDVELIVPLKGLIDTEAELEKLLKEQAKLEQELGRIQAKLGNEQFTSKAPPQVVAKEREKEDELKARLAKTLESQIRMRNQA